MNAEQILDKCSHNQACAEMSRANNLAFYKLQPRMNTIPKLCEWCDTSFNNTMYYYNSPSEHKLICGDCGEKVKTNNEDDDIIFCYRVS